jgi:hypothetical protein
MKQTCILVLGMHRSGTSALTGMLSLLDVYLGSELVEGNGANAKGYFENNTLCLINEKLLNQVDSSWDDVFFDEEKISNVKDVDELKNHIKKEFKHSDNFAIKDPRIAFLFPVYKRVLNELDIDIKIIIPFRHPIEVASSLNRRNNFSCEKGILLWAYHLLLAEKSSREFERVFVGFNELISNTRSAVTLISEKLHIDFKSKYTKNIKQINEYLEPGLKHHNLSIDNLPENAYKIVREILQIQGEFNDGEIIGKFDGLREELFSYKKLFYSREVAGVFSNLRNIKQLLIEAEQGLQQRTEELQKSKQQLSETEQGLQKRSEELEQSKQQLGEKEQLLFQRNQEINAFKDELVTVYASKSWKITGILRKINKLFK